MIHVNPKILSFKCVCVCVQFFDGRTIVLKTWFYHPTMCSFVKPEFCDGPTHIAMDTTYRSDV